MRKASFLISSQLYQINKQPLGGVTRHVGAPGRGRDACGDARPGLGAGGGGSLLLLSFPSKVLLSFSTSIINFLWDNAFAVISFLLQRQRQNNLSSGLQGLRRVTHLGQGSVSLFSGGLPLWLKASPTRQAAGCPLNSLGTWRVHSQNKREPWSATYVPRAGPLDVPFPNWTGRA